MKFFEDEVVNRVKTCLPEEWVVKAYQCKEKSCSDYRGKQSKTKSRKDCIGWQNRMDKSKVKLVDKYPDADLVGNYCRNPDPEFSSTIWCPTGPGDDDFEECELETCSMEGFKVEHDLG